MKRLFLFLFLLIALSACRMDGPLGVTESAPPATPESVQPTDTPEPVVEGSADQVEEAATLAATSTGTPAPDPTATEPPAEPSPTPPAESPTEPPPPTSPPLVSGQALIIDHRSVDLFDQIPPEYLQAAGEYALLLQHASVGANINLGLNCLWNYFPDYPNPNRRPNACDRGILPSELVFGEAYNRSRWLFEFRGNPGWNNKVFQFIDRVDTLPDGEAYDYATFIMGYVESPDILDHFFTNTDPNDQFPGVTDLEALAARHPDTELIWWTLAMARLSEPYHVEFNEQLRAYALANGKILMDIADIESHLPDGTPCTGIDSSENPTDVPAVCDEYVNEVFAGHLNAIGSQRMAKAMWVLFAQLAGWRPDTAG